MFVAALAFLSAGAHASSRELQSAPSGGGGGSTCLSVQDSGKLYDTVHQKSRFPVAASGDGDTPVEVSLGLVNIRILDISPADQTFTARFNTDMYWEREACEVATVMKTACANRVGTWYFVVAPEGGSETITASWTDTTLAGVLQGDFPPTGCVSGDFLEVKSELHHSFDMSWYPFEAHQLELKLESFYSTEYLALQLLDSSPHQHHSPLPASWTLARPWSCNNGTADTLPNGRFGGRGPPVSFDHITCTCVVARVDMGWFFGSLFFGVLLLATNFFVQLGAVASEQVKPDQLASLLKGRAASAAALTFTFSLTMKKTVHGKDASFYAGQTPSSFVVYTLGILFLAASAFWSASVGFLSVMKTRDRSTYGSAFGTLLRRGQAPKLQVEATGGMPPQAQKQMGAVALGEAQRLEEEGSAEIVSPPMSPPESPAPEDSRRSRTEFFHEDVRVTLSPPASPPTSPQPTRPPPLKGDLNGDGMVDAAELFHMWVCKWDFVVILATHSGFFMGTLVVLIQALVSWRAIVN